MPQPILLDPTTAQQILHYLQQDSDQLRDSLCLPDGSLDPSDPVHLHDEIHHRQSLCDLLRQRLDPPAQPVEYIVIESDSDEETYPQDKSASIAGAVQNLHDHFISSTAGDERIKNGLTEIDIDICTVKRPRLGDTWTLGHYDAECVIERLMDDYEEDHHVDITAEWFMAIFRKSNAHLVQALCDYLNAALRQWADDHQQHPTWCMTGDVVEHRTLPLTTES